MLTDAECDAMAAVLADDDGCTMARCGATTREYDPASRAHREALEPLATLARYVNSIVWQYVIDDTAHAWLQSYEVGGDYKRHVDSAPGQTRKVTAVAMLTDAAEYDGGQLALEPVPEVARYPIPRTCGSVLIFEPWWLHYVTPVTRGRRQTVNAGWWGPPFR